ncbi:hypothetical protein ACQPYE_01065 [Actinosynnema sp. CA-299493]
MEQPSGTVCPSTTCACRTTPPPTPESFISVRSAVLLLMSVVIGLMISGLAFIAYSSIAGAAMAGLGAFGCALMAAHTLVR